MMRTGRQVLAATMALVVLLVSVACVGGTCLLTAAFAQPDAMAADHSCCSPSRSDDSAPADNGSTRCDGALKGADAAGTRTAPHQLTLHWLSDLAPADLVAAALQPPAVHPLFTDAAFDPSPPPTLLALGCALNT